MEHESIVRGLLRSPGVEIGAFTSPIPGISPIYVDRFSEYANQPTLAEYFGDSADLPFIDSSLNYVASSHVIEHVANPLAAFLEWFRVLRHDGIIYMNVPDRRLTFDRARPLTLVDHMVEDYRNGVTQCDGTHIEDYVLNVDWDELSPKTPSHKVAEEREELLNAYRLAINSGDEINIHFHTFELQSMVELMERANDVLPLDGGRIDLVRLEPNFPASAPNGFLIVAKVSKLGSMPIFHSPTDILRPGVKKFDRSPKVELTLEEWNERNFPGTSYLDLNKDVAAAVESGQFQSGYSHYQLFGRSERRRVL